MIAYNRIARAGWIVILASLLGCHAPGEPTRTAPALSRPTSTGAKLYATRMTLGAGREWRPYPIVADINRDGHLDIVATHRSPVHENALHIWIGDGANHFQPLEQTWPSPGYSGLAVGDINRDGHLDLLAASHFNRFHTYLGTGSGQFTHAVNPATDGYTASRLADLDGDGNLDAILLGWQTTGIEIYQGDGTGQWAWVTQLTNGGIGRELAIADVNEDGKTDIVSVTANGGVTFYLQNSLDTWLAQSADFVSATREFRSIAVGDINRDGHLDIALNGGFQGPLKANGPDVYLGDGKGTWRAASEGLKVLKPPVSWGIALGDVDGDGHLDIVAGGNMTGGIGNVAYGLFVFRGNGHGQWTLMSDSGLPASGLSPSYGIRLGDLNHDQAVDIISVHGETVGSGGQLNVWVHQ